MKVHSEMISDLKSRQNLIDKRCGEGSTKKLIEFSESLSSLYDERMKILFSEDITKDEKIKQLFDIKRRREELILHTLAMR